MRDSKYIADKAVEVRKARAAKDAASDKLGSDPVWTAASEAERATLLAAVTQASLDLLVALSCYFIASEIEDGRAPFASSPPPAGPGLAKTALETLSPAKVA